MPALLLQVAPVTSDHILKLAKLGGYNSNHFFRVDKGFVAQTAGVTGGRLAQLDRKQRVSLVSNAAPCILFGTCSIKQDFPKWLMAVNQLVSV